MRSPVLFYKFGLHARARRLLLLSSVILCSASVPALANETPKGAPRPVARLVSTSREEVASRQRARVLATVRAAATPTRAAVAPVAAATGSERRLFELINDERRARGRRPLSWDGELTRMARYHSENMARQRFFDHRDRDGLDLSGRAAVHGLRGWSSLAENIAYNQGFDDPEAFAVERWMLSPKHRENILNGDFTHAGLGVVRAPDGTFYFTQVFMRR
jgi:uncharacterized protein YkwD